MPRSRGGPARGSAPVRPTAPAPSRPAPQQQQTRPMSTAPTQTAPQQHAPVQQSQGSGLFGQMASTAAGVAVGSSIGHAIGGFFGGGSSSSAPAADQSYQQPIDSYAQPGQAMDSTLYNRSVAEQGPCAADIKSFTGCMEQNKGDMNICGWYLEQLRACQQAAGKY